MAQLKISKRTVETLQPMSRRYVTWDVDLPAFGCEVMPTGLKSYRLFYRHQGRLRKLTLGRHGSITAEEARSLAKKALGAVANGQDPAADRLLARRAVSVSVAFNEWLDSHVDAKLKPSTRADYRRIFETIIKPALGGKRLPELTRSEVAKLHQRLANSPYAANRTIAVLRSFLNWTERQGLRPEHSNPARLIQPYREHRRERFLSDDEIGRLGEALEASELEEWPWALAAIKLLLFTGARRGEILALKWVEVDLVAGMARLPDSKTGAKTLYLSTPARALLEILPHHKDNPYVICGRLKGSPLIGLPRVWRRVRARAGLDNLRLHDIRHAFASSAAMGGLPLLTIGRLLGHSQPAVTDRYAHFANSPLVQAADRVAELIASQLKAKPS